MLFVKAALLLGILLSILGTTTRSELSLYVFLGCAIGIAIIEVLSNKKEPRL